MSGCDCSEQIKLARRTDLYDFLSANFPSRFVRQGDSLRFKDNHSISIKKGYCGYRDFANDETGNSLDFLLRHLGFSFLEAVDALTGGQYACHDDRKATADPAPSPIERRIDMPEPVTGKPARMLAYLTHRGIPADILYALIQRGLLYQEKEHNNAVFVNRERDFAEAHGTVSFGESFHRVYRTKPDRFWWFRTAADADTAYICEAAIDAVSLYALHRMDENVGGAYYISIAGVANQQAINRIKQTKALSHVILAVDNDKAGAKARMKNNSLEAIIPVHKDWNEDLLVRLNETKQPLTKDVENG